MPCHDRLPSPRGVSVNTLNKDAKIRKTQEQHGHRRSSRQTSLDLPCVYAHALQKEDSCDWFFDYGAKHAYALGLCLAYWTYYPMQNCDCKHFWNTAWIQSVTTNAIAIGGLKDRLLRSELTKKHNDWTSTCQTQLSGQQSNNQSKNRSKGQRRQKFKI